MLVVDDNVDAADSLAMLLQHEGPRGADWPTTARRRWRWRRARQPDVVLLDIGLPGMDGYEVAARLREAGHERAASGRHHRLRPGGGPAPLAAAGFDHHLVKPVDGAVLRKIITDISTRFERAT